MIADYANQPPILATDLDGTFIPPEIQETSESACSHRSALQTIQAAQANCQLKLVYVTGRHLGSILRAVAEHALPTPDWIVADVGTTIYCGQHPHYLNDDAYVNHLEQITSGVSVDELGEFLGDFAEIKRQEPEKQGRFKLSFYCDINQLGFLRTEMLHRLRDRQLNYSIVASVDPFHHRGLIDIVPSGIHKGSAIAWLVAKVGANSQSVVFSGDSGNDTAALTYGFRGILVGNATIEVREEVQQHHAERGTSELVYFAKQGYTAGVLEGLQHFGVLK